MVPMMLKSFLRSLRSCRPSLLALSLGLPLLAGCDLKDSPPPPDPSGVTRLEVSCGGRGFLGVHIWGERGVMVLRFWGRSWVYAPGFVGEAWGGGPGCMSAPERGAVEVYLKRARDGRWVRGWVEAGLVEGAGGSPEFRVLGELKTQAVEEADLPFERVPDPRAAGGFYLEDRPLPPAPVWLPRAFCLQPGVGWPWGVEPGNWNPDYPPVAPASPPALYYGYEGDVGDPAFIEYANGKYAGRRTDADRVSGAFAVAPADGPLKIVLYASWRAEWHPLYGRWVRIYPREPISMRLEGGGWCARATARRTGWWSRCPRASTSPASCPRRTTSTSSTPPTSSPPSSTPTRGGERAWETWASSRRCC